jgi:predicted MFS family arabinose efflux permease
MLLPLIHKYKKSFAGISRQVWILAIALFINRAGSMVLAFCSLYMINERHFDVKDAAWVMTFYGAGSILGSLAGGWLADNFNAKRILIISLIGSALVLLFMLIAKDKYAIAAIIFTYALIADIFRPANTIAVSHFSSEEDRTRSFSLVRLAINLGFTIGPAIGGLVAAHLGYYLLFIIDSLSTIGAAIYIYYKLPFFVNPSKKKDPKLIKSTLGQSAYLNPRYLIFIALVFFYGITFFQLIFTMPVYFNKVDHYTEDKIGWLLAINGAIVVILEMPIVAWCSKKNHPFKFITLGCAFLVIAFSTLLLGNSIFLISLLFIFFITLSEIFAMPFLMSYTIDAAPKERRGEYSALYSIAYGISFIFAPSIGLKMGGAYGMTTMLYAIIGVSIFITIMFALFANSKKATSNKAFYP